MEEDDLGRKVENLGKTGTVDGKLGDSSGFPRSLPCLTMALLKFPFPHIYVNRKTVKISRVE